MLMVVCAFKGVWPFGTSRSGKAGSPAANRDEDFYFLFFVLLFRCGYLAVHQMDSGGIVDKLKGSIFATMLRDSDCHRATRPVTACCTAAV